VFLAAQKGNKKNKNVVNIHFDINIVNIGFVILNNSGWWFLHSFFKRFIVILERLNDENNLNLAVFVDMGFDKAHVLWIHRIFQALS